MRRATPNDLDLLIIGQPDRIQLYEAADRAERRLGLPVNSTVRSRRRWNAAGDPLVHQIKSSPVGRVGSRSCRRPGRRVMRWTRGESVIERLLHDRRLQRVSGAQADGATLLARAHRILETAQTIAEDDPDSAYVLAMTLHGRRAPPCWRIKGSDRQPKVATTRSRKPYVRRPATPSEPSAPCGGGAMSSNTRRIPGDEAEPDEVAEAIKLTRGIIEAAERLLPSLTLF